MLSFFQSTAQRYVDEISVRTDGDTVVLAAVWLGTMPQLSLVLLL